MINKLPKIELHCHLDGSVRAVSYTHLWRHERSEFFIYLFINSIIFSYESLASL